MASLYGPAFGNAYGTDVTSRTATLWSAGLAQFGPAQLDRGFKACLAVTVGNAGAFPPSLPQFRTMCLGTDAAEEVKETPEQIAARLLARDKSDLAYFLSMNAEWRERGHTDELFAIDNCFNYAQRAALGIA